MAATKCKLITGPLSGKISQFRSHLTSTLPAELEYQRLSFFTTLSPISLELFVFMQFFICPTT